MQALPEICSVDGVKLAVARLSEEAVLGLDGEDVLVTDVVGLGVDLLRQGEVEVADGAIVFIIGFNRWDFCPLSSWEMNLSCVE